MNKKRRIAELEEENESLWETLDQMSHMIRHIYGVLYSHQARLDAKETRH